MTILTQGYIKTEDFFEDISNDVERWFDTANYNENDKGPLPMGKNKKYLVFLKLVSAIFLKMAVLQKL